MKLVTNFDKNFEMTGVTDVMELTVHIAVLDTPRTQQRNRPLITLA